MSFVTGLGESLEEPSARSADDYNKQKYYYHQQPTYHQPYSTPYLVPTLTIGKLDKKNDKFDKLFLKIAKFIIHKVGLLIPYLVESLFGINLTYDTYNSYGSGYGSGVQEFKQFGLLGLIPVIIINILTKVSAFVKILQKNTFLRRFLVPAGVILIVVGSLVFLTWWLYPGDDYDNKYLSYEGSYYPGTPQYQQVGYYQAPSSNYQVSTDVKNNYARNVPENMQ